MILAMGLFCLNDTLVKLLSADWPTAQIIVLRGLFALAIVSFGIAASGGLHAVRALAHPLVLSRSALEGFTAFAFISAITVLPLADTTAIVLSAPLLITALSALFLREAVGWRRWSAVVVGFLGVLLVVRPDGAVNPAALLALGAACGVAQRDLVTRRLPAALPNGIVTLGTTLGALGAGLLLAPTAAWQAVAPHQLALTAGAALLLALGNHAIIIACRVGELSVISPFRYAVIVFAVALGVAVFDDWPRPSALAGIGCIVASGLYTLHRERRRSRQTIA